MTRLYLYRYRHVHFCIDPEHRVIASAAGYLGALLGVLMVVPQIVRTLREPAVPGVSGISWALTGLSSLTWLLYGLRADEAPQIPGNVLTVSGAILIVLAVPSTVSVFGRTTRLGLAVAALVVLAVLAPAPAIGLVAFGIGLVSALPQLVTSLGRPRGAASALSVPAWILRAAAQVSWLVYAVLKHDLVVTVSAAVILASALLLVGYERWPSRRSPAASAESAAEPTVPLVPSARGALGERSVENVDALC